MSGWEEVTIIVRFWIIAGIAVAFGVGLFYAEFVSHG
jgi:phospho-N-acetylmuramoyl-pentapeptide-transferase